MKLANRRRKFCLLCQRQRRVGWTCRSCGAQCCGHQCGLLIGKTAMCWKCRLEKGV